MGDDLFSGEEIVAELLNQTGASPGFDNLRITSNTIAVRARGVTYLDGQRSLVVEWSGAASGRSGDDRFRLALDGYSLIDTATGLPARTLLDVAVVGVPGSPETLDMAIDASIIFPEEAIALADQRVEVPPEPEAPPRAIETESGDAPSMVGVTPAVAENRHAVAVIIGNKNYATSLPDVDFAANDAVAMRAYVIQMLGYREGNIIDLRDATRAQIDAVFGNRETHEGKLYNWIRRGKSDVFVFYSGHGVPGLQDRRGYLLPVDGYPNLAEITGYPVDLL